MTAEKSFQKGAWPGSRNTLNFRVVNANSFKIAKDTNFKFDTHNPRDSPHMTPENIFEMVRGQDHVPP